MDSLFDDDAVVLNTKALVAGISRHHSTASTHAESPMGAGQGAITNEYTLRLCERTAFFHTDCSITLATKLTESCRVRHEEE